MKIEVGDTVVSLVTECDVVKGREYKVVDVDKNNRWVDVLDDVGDLHTMMKDQVLLVDKPTHTTTYTRILEAIAGPEAVTMARNISEALNEQ